MPVSNLLLLNGKKERSLRNGQEIDENMSFDLNKTII